MGVYGESIDIESPFFRPLRDDRRILTQAIEMRLDTASGTIWTDPDYGLSVSQMIGDGMTDVALARLGERIRAEVEKDERIERVTHTAEETRIGGKVSVRVSLVVTPKEIGPFELVLAIDDVSVEVLTK